MRYVAAISCGSTYMRIFDYYGDFAAKVITPFCRGNLAKWGKERIPGTNQQQWKVTHVFARSNFDKTEYRLPSSLLKEFIEFAVHRGYREGRIKIEQEPLIEGAPAEFKLKPGFEVPRENQKEWIDYQLGDGQVKVNGANTGEGKALLTSTPVRVPGGWKPIGKLLVGDLVMTVDGSYTAVRGVFPQGVTPTYTVTFEDGREVLACPEHLWEVKTDDGKGWRTLNTRQLMLSSLKFEIPLIRPERNRELEDLVNPYNIGYLEKPILDWHLEGSYYQRLALIRGCLDRGGLPKLNGEIHYTHKNSTHVKQLQKLIWGIGGVAKCVTLVSSYRLEIKYFHPADLFTVDWKQHELIGMDFKSLTLKIVSIEPTGTGQTVCISVQHPSALYVVENYIVTHNTYMALYTMVKLGLRTLVTVQPRYVTTWLNDIAKVIDIAKEDVVVWENTCLESLANAIEKGVISPKIIILPMTRIMGHLRHEKTDMSLTPLDDIFRRINAGYRIIDEVHESFHEVSSSLFYGNFKKLVVLSATLSADDPFINKMYKIMLPISIRLKDPDAQNYIDVIGYLYRINIRRHRVKTMQLGIYNDMAFEQSILDSEELTRLYCQVAKKAYEEYYLDVREEGTKCLFFFSRVNMCQTMLEFFRKEYPGMDFETFLGTLDKKDPLKYLKHENVITTPGSCGTGKDIGGLVTVICFHTVISSQRNKQMIGRLRELMGRFDNRIPLRFVFTVCVDLDKHKECFEKRKVHYSKKMKSLKIIDSNCEAN